jgi:hypothetical protein
LLCWDQPARLTPQALPARAAPLSVALSSQTGRCMNPEPAAPMRIESDLSMVDPMRL